MHSLRSSPPPASAAAFVLAGGRSSRMGSDKALALFGGIPLIQVAMETLAQAGLQSELHSGLQPSIAGARSDLASYAPCIPDNFPGSFPESGPMGGIHAALSSSFAAEWNLFLPVDLPLMPPSLLRSLLKRARLTLAPVTVCRLNGRIQPFPVVLHASVLPAIAQRLKQGQTACHRAWETIPAELGTALHAELGAALHVALDAVAVESLLQCGHCDAGRGRNGLPPALWFESANTPEDLARLNRTALRFLPCNSNLAIPASRFQPRDSELLRISENCPTRNSQVSWKREPSDPSQRHQRRKTSSGIADP